MSFPRIRPANDNLNFKRAHKGIVALTVLKILGEQMAM